jgi:hypothetical protein
MDDPIHVAAAVRDDNKNLRNYKIMNGILQSELIALLLSKNSVMKVVGKIIV